MPAEVVVGTPLADALNTAILGKITELGWANGAEDDALAEYFVLMLANGKTKEEIAAEITGDLLGLGADDPNAHSFAQWVVDQVDVLNEQLNANATSAPAAQDASAIPTAQDDEMMGDGFGAESADAEMETSQDGPSELNAPTGPKAMRNGNFRGGREKRMLGQINRALAQPQDVLHRIRSQTGNERISRQNNTTGLRGVGRQPRMSNGRAASIVHGLTQMGGVPGVSGMPGVPGIPSGPAAMNGPMNGPMNGHMNGHMNGGPMNPMANSFMMPGQQEIFAMMEQQNRMLQNMQQQLLMQVNGMPQIGHHQNGLGRGKSLFERTSRPPGSFRGRGGPYQPQHQAPHHNGSISAPASEQSESVVKPEADAASEDVDMTQGKREPTSPEETVCMYNLRCTNKECKFAHQSPAAPPGVTVDVSDTCSFAAACKNRKCVGRHPSPATRMAHQSEQDCKFYPNCTNPRCPFRHPAMPPCRNGGECKMPNCKFTHVKTPCRFRPCTNRYCHFSHEEGQRGTFQDKVWTATDGGGGDGKEREGSQHLSERKFVDEDAKEDLVLPDDETNGQEIII